MSVTLDLFVQLEHDKLQRCQPNKQTRLKKCREGGPPNFVLLTPNVM